MAVVTSSGASPHRRRQPSSEDQRLPAILDKRVNDGISCIVVDVLKLEISKTWPRRQTMQYRMSSVCTPPMTAACLYSAHDSFRTKMACAWKFRKCTV